MLQVLLRAAKGPFDVASPEVTLERNLVATNAGNLIFSHAAHRVLRTERTEVHPNWNRANPADADQINERYDVFVVPLANAFRLDFERYLSRLAELVEKLTIPVVVFGVGAQAGLDHDTEPLRPMEPTVKRFARAVLDKSASIGVRGEFTEAYLRGLGFRDVDVIGCPSMFLHGEKLQVEKRVEALTPDSKISVHVDRHVDAMGGVVMSHYRRYPHLTYIAQDTGTLATLLWGDAPEDVGKSSDVPVYASHPLFRDNKVRFFVDPWTWVSYLSQFDFAFGTRIHGTIAALLAGTPGYILAHDSRTLELARYFEIPYRLITKVSPDLDAAELYEEADFAALHKGHRARLATMVEFLDKNGLDHVFRDDGGTAVFDEELRAVQFPRPVETLYASDQAELFSRLRWLRDTNAGLRKEVAQLQRKVGSLERSAKQTARLADQVAAVRRQVANTPYRRLRRLGGRTLRRLGLRR